MEFYENVNGSFSLSCGCDSHDETSDCDYNCDESCNCDSHDDTPDIEAWPDEDKW